MDKTTTIKTVIIDDNKRIRYLIKEILDFEDDIEVCAEAETLQEAKDALTKYQPDIAVFDLLFDEQVGDSFLKEIPQVSGMTKIIILSAHSESLYAAKCIAAGAKGYVCKDKVVQALPEAIRAVHSGKEYISS